MGKGGNLKTYKMLATIYVKDLSIPVLKGFFLKLKIQNIKITTNDTPFHIASDNSGRIGLGM